jgi:hypothetical protein
MRLKSILIHSVAAVTLALVLPASPVTPFHSTAQAATNVSVSIGTFYDDLAPYGSWVNYEDAYVFVPANINADWRPYTAGHWVHTKRYGWLWVSDEPFGWATYHYGRWGYAEDIGWYWVPGKRWAPAWVSWRRSADHFVWASLPPGRGGDVEIEINAADIPDDYWVAVPSRDFLDADLSVVIINDNSERIRVVDQAEPVGNVTIENNVVVNNVIDVDYVEKQTQQKVKTVAVKETDDPKQIGKGSDQEVSIFNGEVKEEGNAKPKEVKDVQAVKKERAQQGESSPETTGSTTPAPETQGKSQNQTEEQPIKKKKATGQSANQPPETQPEEGQGQPMMKKKKATGQSSTQPDEAQPEEGQEQPVKKKKATGQSSENQPSEAQPEEGQPMKKKKNAGQSQEAQPEQGQGKPAKGCDPTSGEGCAQ